MNKTEIVIKYLNEFFITLGVFSILDYVFYNETNTGSNLPWVLGFTILQFGWDAYKGKLK